MANLGSTVIHGNLNVTGTINGYKLSTASEKTADSNVIDNSGGIPTTKAVYDYVNNKMNTWKTDNAKSNSNLSVSISGKTVTVTGPAGYYSGSISKSGSIADGSCRVTGGTLSVTSTSYTPTVTTSIAKNVGTESTTKGTYYIQVGASSSSMTIGANTSAVTDTHTAGYITAGTSNPIAAQSKSISIGAGSAATKYINIPAGTISSGSTDNSKTYAVNTTTVPANGFLYIGEGYYPNTQISLAQIIPDDPNYTNAGNGNILSGYEAYDPSGNKLIGTIPTINPSATYYTATNTGFGQLPIGYNSAVRYINVGALSAQSINNFTLTGDSSSGTFTVASAAKSISPVSKAGWLGTGTSTTINGHSENINSDVDISGSELNTHLTYTMTATPKLKLASTAAYVNGKTKTVTKTISSVTLGSSSDTTTTTLGVSVSSKGQLNVTADSGTTNYLGWKIAKDSSDSLTFTYIG